MDTCDDEDRIRVFTPSTSVWLLPSTVAALVVVSESTCVDMAVIPEATFRGRLNVDDMIRYHITQPKNIKYISRSYCYVYTYVVLITSCLWIYVYMNERAGFVSNGSASFGFRSDVVRIYTTK